MVVAGVNTGVNLGANTGVNVDKKSSKGAKIGAGVGVAVGIARSYLKRDVINQLGDSLILAGHSRTMANVSKGIGIVLGVGLLAGIGALAGKGAEKVVNHFRKKEPTGVIPGKNPNPAPQVEGDPFEKYRKNPDMMRNVKSKDGDEYVIQNGHPKVVYKKDKETGKLIYQSAVYDGSWGKEMSDEDLIASVKESEKLAKLQKEGYTTYMGSDGKVSYVKK